MCHPHQITLIIKLSNITFPVSDREDREERHIFYYTAVGWKRKPALQCIVRLLQTDGGEIC